MADSFSILITFDDETTELWSITADGNVDWGSEPKHIPIESFIEMIKLHKLLSGWMSLASAKKIEIEKESG